MDNNMLHKMLTSANTPKNTASWLRRVYFPEIVSRFNAEESRKRFALYQNERIPTNERNLTDVRTRMGVLIEFEIARISNDILKENGIDDIFWSYVVANRFPDLEVRKNSGERQLRLEIKCPQCVAEEKSANFDTLKKDINPFTEYVIVCLWDWSKSGSDVYGWDSVPIIYKIYVLHAYSLAALRDCYWLNDPPANLGNGFQGFDVRNAVTCKKGAYSKEQGNYGKIMRIWKEASKYRPNETEELLDTEKEYLLMKKESEFHGFRLLANEHLLYLSDSCEKNIEEIVKDGIIIGYENNGYMYVLKSRAQKCWKEIAVQNKVCTVIMMNDKYRCGVYRFENGEFKQIAKDKKPKSVIEIIRRS